jgi:hypothetical protein
MNTTSMTHYQDPWQAAANEAEGMEGGFLKSNSKDGRWLLDDAEVETGPNGLRVAFLMSTAMHGWVLWEDGRIIERKTRRYADGPPEQRGPDGWDPSTSCLGVTMPDEEGAGRLITWASSSWSGRAAFVRFLLKPFVRLQLRQFPMVTLGFKPQKDSYGNHAPIFDVIAWRPASDFASILGEEPTAAQLEGPRERLNGPPADAGDGDEDIRLLLA